jgi:hypothetical protein
LPGDTLVREVSTDHSEPYDPTADHAYPDERLNEVLPVIREDTEIQTYLQAQNVNAVTRMGYNDHGAKHVEIVRNRALTLYDLLKRGGVGFNGATGRTRYRRPGRDAPRHRPRRPPRRTRLLLDPVGGGPARPPPLGVLRHC